jgi:hypothetical protein
MAPTELRSEFEPPRHTDMVNGSVYSVRADSGNDISNAKPSLLEGAAGAGGSIRAPASGDGLFAPASFVTVPTGNSIIAGASQPLRV